LAWIAATAGNGLLTRALKVIFERTRPLHEHGLLSSEGWSFPSGHASGAAAVFTMGRQKGYLTFRMESTFRPWN
jgi:undecaprenyl-diphosphatase